MTVVEEVDEKTGKVTHRAVNRYSRTATVMKGYFNFGRAVKITLDAANKDKFGD